MPTTRSRHTITETDEVIRAIDEAARRWPEDRDSRARLLHRLVEAGYEAIRQQRREHAADRERAIRRTSGALTGVYPPGYLGALRDEWPG
jgi:hypothetical protein